MYGEHRNFEIGPPTALAQRNLPINGAPDTNRTCDLSLRRGLLYPLSYGGNCKRKNNRAAPASLASALL